MLNNVSAISSKLSVSLSLTLQIDTFEHYTAAISPSSAVVFEYAMGNCQVCLSSSSVHDAGEDSVTLVRVTDGQIFEYPGPVFIKDLIFGFEGFAVFHYNTIEHPLPPETELKFNEVYYLRPWKSPEELAKLPDSGKSVSYGKLGCLRSPLKNIAPESRPKVKKVRFVDDATQDHSSRCETFSPAVSQQNCDSSGIAAVRPAMKLLPQKQDGVVRVKLVISKSHLSDLMATTENVDTVLERIIAPLLCPKSAAAVETTRSLSPKFSWKPLLDHIPED